VEETNGAYCTLLRELLIYDDQETRLFLRMTYESFQVLLAGVRPLIEKKDRKPLVQPIPAFSFTFQGCGIS